jgi:hypothetical protein
MADLSMPACSDNTTPLPEPTALDTAIALAQRSLANYGRPDFRDPNGISYAHGHVTEALRILLHTLGVEAGERL